jgi:hypothetical protein
MEHGWVLSCCSRTKMPDLREEFIPGNIISSFRIIELTQPDIVTRFHQDRVMQHYFEENIQTFVNDATYTIEILAIWTLPRMKCELYEFKPIGNPFGSHMALTNGKFQFSKPRCIPLALSQTTSKNIKQDLVPYEAYVQKLIDENLEKFAEICYAEMDDNFMDHLLKLLVKYKPRDDKEVSNSNLRSLTNMQIEGYSQQLLPPAYCHTHLHSCAIYPTRPI